MRLSACMAPRRIDFVPSPNFYYNYGQQYNNNIASGQNDVGPGCLFFRGSP